MEKNLSINTSEKNTVGSDCNYAMDYATECIIAMKVYGQCRQQDCLLPQFTTSNTAADNPGGDTNDSIPIQGSKSGEVGEIKKIGGLLDTGNNETSLGINQGGLLIFNPNSFDHVEVVSGSFQISTITIINVQEQNLFASDGYWKVDVRYRFNYKLKFLDPTGNSLDIHVGEGLQQEICAYSSYDKQIVLFGGKASKDVVVASNLFTPNGAYAYQNAPYAQVEGKATPLAVIVEPVSTTVTENGVTSVQTKMHIGVTVGLFTIIKLFRLVNTTMLSNGTCEVPPCKQISSGDPCSLFNEIPFPFDEFDPSDIPK